MLVAESVGAEQPTAQRDVLAEVDVEKQPTLGAQQGFSVSPWIEELRVVAKERQVDHEIYPVLGSRGADLGHGQAHGQQDARQRQPQHREPAKQGLDRPEEMVCPCNAASTVVWMG